MPSTASNRVREWRQRRGLSQQALAESARITRQSMGAIEACRTSPAVDIALRIAQALECTTEELFGAATAPEPLEVEAAAPLSNDRVVLTRLQGRWVAWPLVGTGLRVSADAVGTTRHGRASVTPLSVLKPHESSLLMMGCATALGLLCDRANISVQGGRAIWLPGSSTHALQALHRRQVHIAGVHLTDSHSGEDNVPDVKKQLGNREAVTLITLARWQAGLILPAGNPAKIRRVSDLACKGVRVITREAGSGARRLFDRQLHTSGIAARVSARAPLIAHTHLEVAQAIALGAADVGIGTHDVAIALGLGFLPLAEERYDLVIARSSMSDIRVQRVLEVMTSGAARQELSALGYDMTTCGRQVAQLGRA